MTSRYFPKVSLACFAFVLFIALPRTSHASTYKFCANWVYHFEDAGLGEDYLLHSTSIFGYPYGLYAARYTLATVFINGQQVWGGFLDTSGCTGDFAGSDGDYEFRIQPWLQKGGTGVIIFNNSTEAEQGALPAFSWFDHLPTPSTPTTRNMNFGLFYPLASVAAAIERMLAKTDNGLVAPLYEIHAQEDCNNGVDDACFDPDTNVLFLGFDVTNQYWLGYNKSTVGHEFGHAVMHNLMGDIFIAGNYGDNPGQVLCKCDHVLTSSQLHCFQSRENQAAANGEAWGHFYAADTYNNGSQSTAYFAYYKEVLLDDANGTTCDGNPYCLHPPVQIGVHNNPKWMFTNCLANDKGTEADWLSFLWWVHTKTTDQYSYNDLNVVYRRACTGGTTAQCNFTNVTWTGTHSLRDAVNASTEFSANKKQHFLLTAGDYEIDY